MIATAAPLNERTSSSMLNQALIDQLLESAGISAECWSFNQTLRQDTYRDKLKIPVLSNHLLPGIRTETRAKIIPDAYGHVDGTSWRWEVWCGWTTGASHPGEGLALGQ